MHEGLASLMRVQSDVLSIWVTPEVYKRIIRGHRLSASLAQFPRIFPDTYVALVRASEETGKLVLVLERLTEWLDRRERVERHIKKAMLYPVFVAVVAFVLTMGLFRTVIPSILETVIDLGVDLPAPTQMLLLMVKIIEQPFSWILLVAALIAFTVYARKPEGRERLLTLAMHVPILGGILKFSSCSRYAHTMSLLLDSGVDIIRGVRIAADASGNPLLKKDALRIAKDLREGQYYGETLSASPLYPTLLGDMIKVGDESGKLASIVRRCAELMEEDAMHRVDIFLNLLEPLVLTLISAGVAFLILAVLMPLSSIVAAL